MTTATPPPPPEQSMWRGISTRIYSPQRPPRQMLLLGAVFAAQVTLCTSLLMFGYAQAGAPGVNWAIVSAIVVLQPGVHQSLEMSALRIIANLLGALVGFGFGWSLGSGSWQIIAAMIVVIFLCQALRLEPSLRTACVSVIIVMTAGEHVAMTSVGRVAAVIIGSVVAVSVQLLGELLQNRLLARRSQPAPSAAPRIEE